MHKIDVETNSITGDKVYKTTLSNGLRLYIAPKQGFIKKTGMFGTIYGSLENDFIDIVSGERKKVPDGIAHFLEHKLFEQEGENVLDVFAKMGVSANAYTSYDQTVYYFETDKNHQECLKKLIGFVSNPHFTDENVEKEKGIIIQEMKMYEDNPEAVVYDNLMKAMYINNPIKINIAGTMESIPKITKELLYTCYNTFYNPKNMFYIVVGDVDIDETIEVLEKEIKKSINQKPSGEVVKFIKQEPENVAKKEIIKKLNISNNLVCVGFKMKPANGKENIKRDIITQFLNEMCFSNISDFYETLYKKNIVTHEPSITYESGENFAHLVISGYAEKIEVFEKELLNYIKELKEKGVDSKLFEIVKLKKEGENIYNLEKATYTYRNIIESIIQKTNVYDNQEILSKISKNDIDEFVKESLDFNKICFSKVLKKESK